MDHVLSSFTPLYCMKKEVLDFHIWRKGGRGRSGSTVNFLYGVCTFFVHLHGEWYRILEFLGKRCPSLSWTVLPENGCNRLSHSAIISKIFSEQCKSHWCCRLPVRPFLVPPPIQLVPDSALNGTLSTMLIPGDQPCWFGPTSVQRVPPSLCKWRKWRFFCQSTSSKPLRRHPHTSPSPLGLENATG